MHIYYVGLHYACTVAIYMHYILEKLYKTAYTCSLLVEHPLFGFLLALKLEGRPSKIERSFLGYQKGVDYIVPLRSKGYKRALLIYFF